jgi:hypothetical protein
VEKLARCQHERPERHHDPDRPQRVTLPTLQILAAFMSDLSRDDWYGRALSVHTGLGSGTVLQCLYWPENWGWLESRCEDRDVATASAYDARVPLPAAPARPSGASRFRQRAGTVAATSVQWRYARD